MLHKATTPLSVPVIELVITSAKLAGTRIPKRVGETYLEVIIPTYDLRFTILCVPNDLSSLIIIIVLMRRFTSVV